MKYLFRVLFVAALPALLTMLVRKVDRRLSGAPAGARQMPIDELPVIEPQQEDPLLPSAISMSPRGGF